MMRGKLNLALFAVAAAGLLVVASFLQHSLNRDREALGLTRMTPLENAPPVLAFTTVALGGFRGLIANILWVRASDLHEKDKFFEMMQLADWITKLQPHFTSVWVFQAWNMAYNISIKFDDHKLRWHWVHGGIQLLRDDGIRFNPHDPLLYRELAWFYQHKMGANLDDAHNYYKRVWAEKMQPFFPNGTPDIEALLNPKTAGEQEQVRVLREEFKLDPVWIQKVEEEYGPLEWRLPETHAIYWAVLGLDKSARNERAKEHRVQLRRVIFQSMQLAFHRGRLFFPVKGGFEFVYGPNLEIVGRANRAYEQMMEDEQEMRSSIATGQKNFLKTVVYFLYTHNRTAEAQQWFDYLRKNYPNSVHQDVPGPDTSLDDFAFTRITEDVGETSRDRVTAIVLGLLMQSFVNLAVGKYDEAVGYARFSERVHQRYQASVVGSESDERVRLSDISILRGEALRNLLDPDTGLQEELALLLRGELGLSATQQVTQLPRLQLDSSRTNAPGRTSP